MCWCSPLGCVRPCSSCSDGWQDADCSAVPQDHAWRVTDWRVLVEIWFSLASANEPDDDCSKWVIAAEIADSGRVFGEHAPDGVASLHPACDEETGEALYLDLVLAIACAERTR